MLHFLHATAVTLCRRYRRLRAGRSTWVLCYKQAHELLACWLLLFSYYGVPFCWASFVTFTCNLLACVLRSYSGIHGFWTNQPAYKYLGMLTEAICTIKQAEVTKPPVLHFGLGPYPGIAIQ